MNYFIPLIVSIFLLASAANAQYKPAPALRLDFEVLHKDSVRARSLQSFGIYIPADAKRLDFESLHRDTMRIVSVFGTGEKPYQPSEPKRLDFEVLHRDIIHEP